MSLHHVQLAVRFACACLLVSCTITIAAPRDIAPGKDSDVIETLPARVRTVALTPEAAASSAREWIKLSRVEAEPRYLGRAQAVLAAWWDKPDAPPALAILQATVQQSRHEFDASRKTLQSALKRDPAQPQGWLTLATLERLAGQYDAAAAACEEVGRSGATLYAQACRLETASLRGGFDAARQGYEQLAQRAGDAGTRAWLLSLLAESEERAGRDAQAARAYQASLAGESDGYTALAYADMLLRTARPQEALSVLKNQPASDATLLRQAWAYKQMGDERWKPLNSELHERFAALDARGEDRAPHARERALGALWLDGNAAEASDSAQLNLGLQKEPLDWWLALHTAQLAGRTALLDTLRAALVTTGLKDARLAQLQSAAAR
jgi:tetratricopeptide (TPR) repeat protein